MLPKLAADFTFGLFMPNAGGSISGAVGGLIWRPSDIEASAITEDATAICMSCITALTRDAYLFDTLIGDFTTYGIYGELYFLSFSC
jgi:hypothetical protein